MPRLSTAASFVSERGDIFLVSQFQALRRKLQTLCVARLTWFKQTIP